MASTTYYNAIQQLYVQFLDRPADVLGMQYWEGVLETARGDTTAVAAAFAHSPEYTASVAGLDAPHLIAAVYQNMFGRAPDLAGLNYWTDAMTRGGLTVDNLARAIAGGAQGSDLHAYINKVSGATAFTANLDTTEKILGYNGAAANTAAKIYLTGITDDASLSHALGILSGMLPPDQFHSAQPALAPAYSDAGAEAAHEVVATLVGVHQVPGADMLVG